MAWGKIAKVPDKISLNVIIFYRVRLELIRRISLIPYAANRRGRAFCRGGVKVVAKDVVASASPCVGSQHDLYELRMGCPRGDDGGKIVRIHFAGNSIRDRWLVVDVVESVIICCPRLFLIRVDIARIADTTQSCRTHIGERHGDLQSRCRGIAIVHRRFLRHLHVALPPDPGGLASTSDGCADPGYFKLAHQPRIFVSFIIELYSPAFKWRSRCEVVTGESRRSHGPTIPAIICNKAKLIVVALQLEAGIGHTCGFRSKRVCLSMRCVLDILSAHVDVLALRT